MSKLPTIGVMLGDVAGICPEISARALASGVLRDHANVVVIGDARVLELFTTPAPGTAYDIVEGRADPGAMEHALRLAAKLASARIEARAALSAA